MLNLTFQRDKILNTIHIDSFVEVLEKQYNKVYISRRVSICKNNNLSMRTVLSTNENIKEIDFDCNYSNEYCYVLLKNDKKLTIMKSEMDYKEVLILPVKTLLENEDLIKLDSLTDYRGELPTSIKIESKETISIPIDKLTAIENMSKLSSFLGYIPEKVIDFRDKKYTIKIYEKNNIVSKIRYKFIEETINMNVYDNSFYDDKKIRISDNKTLKYNGLIFIRTDNNNCIIIDEKNRVA